MRSKFSYFLFLFLMMSFLLLAENTAAQSIEYQGWIYNTKYFIINDVTYKILITEGGNSILLKSDEGSTSLDLNSCEETSYKRYCYNYTEFDKEEQDYKAFLYVYSIQPEITLTRTISDNILEVGDISEFKATLANTGEYDANSVSFIEEFPENIEIVNVKEGAIANNSVIWEGEIKKGESVEIVYKIRSLGETDKYQKAYVTYFDGISNEEIISSSVRLYSPKTLYIEMTTDKEDYELNEDILLNIKLSNEGKGTVKINSLYISIPDSMQVTDYSGVSKKEDNEYFFEDSIDENDSAEMDFELTGQRDGMFFVVVSGDYDYRGHNYKIQNEKVGYLVHNEGIEIISSIDSVEYVNSNQRLVVFTKVKNKNSFTRIKNLQLNTKSNISFFNKGSYSSIDTNETVILLNTEINVPDEKAEKIYPISFNVTYAIESGQIFSALLDRKIVVKPSEMVKITPSISSYSVLEDEAITISVNLKNPKAYALKEVFVKVNIPKDFQVNGPTSVFSSLDASQDAKIMTFVITPSRVEKKNVFIVNFTASYVDEGKEYLISQEKSITVSPRIPKVTIQKDIVQKEAYKGEIIDVSYLIKNSDTVPVHDLRIYMPKSKEFDTLNTFDKYLEKISQSETITFDGEQIRAKKIGSVDSGKAILFFKDVYGREFNVTSNTVAISVKEADIDEPAVTVDKYANKTQAYVGENIEFIINITNIGQKRAVGNVSEEDMAVILPFYTNKLIRKNISFEKEGEYIIPRTVFYYNYGTNAVRAYSDEIKITVRNISAGAQESANKEAQQKSDGSDISGDLSNQTAKESIFRKIYNWFRLLFTKR